MNKLYCCLIKLLIAAILAVGAIAIAETIWLGSTSCSGDSFSECWKKSVMPIVLHVIQWLVVVVVVLTGCALIFCCWSRMKMNGQSNGQNENGDETPDCEQLDPPYPDPPVWKCISGFRYESDLKLVRLKRRLSNIPPEAQYIVAKDYTVSFNLDGKRRCITVPRGTLTDLASVPRVFRCIVGRVGPHLEASIVHDYQYSAWQKQQKSAQNQLALTPNEHMRRFADELMLHAMNAANMGCSARLIYCAVRLFGCCVFFREKRPPPCVREHLPQCCGGCEDDSG